MVIICGTTYSLLIDLHPEAISVSRRIFSVVTSEDQMENSTRNGISSKVQIRLSSMGSITTYEEGEGASVVTLEFSVRTIIRIRPSILSPVPSAPLPQKKSLGLSSINSSSPVESNSFIKYG